ncbi:putative cytochrome oxidase assembly protein [Actinoplanes missouriensis 431]|uniref:Putative cytochrome oxidase assembly protein n=1 Tax=Actinoplanes missouriensis (strain ATCC 14538 / DSM 43046 / CBS 188.64 / JCM 3121 / NBRC 102363 / NCIMB 12654 / NRRL B-3342 / UNCC 431) TaxID=512565 RepID=I0H1F7_ACTM4|nr:putative cytochrome oxidase assembly protein [Actinoplanes missouriensis 431]
MKSSRSLLESASLSRPGQRLASALRPLALASLVANAGLIVTGAAVRLTGSGLGCPTWPKCTDDSYTTTAEMGVHGVIEFGNRLLTFVLVALAFATFFAALVSRPRRKSLIILSIAVALGVPGQGVVGGITVLTKLNPWVVGLHFILSIALIAGCYALWRRVDEGDGRPVPLVPTPIRHLAWITALVSFAVIAVGVVVTGSGPHAGDQGAKRNGLDPAAISQVHADLVFLLIGLSVALWFALRALNAPPATIRAAGVLIAVEFGQGIIGFVQYFTHLPVILVAAHMLGAAVTWTATLAVLWSLRTRPELPRPTDQPTPAVVQPAEPVPAS